MKSGVSIKTINVYEVQTTLCRVGFEQRRELCALPRGRWRVPLSMHHIYASLLAHSRAPRADHTFAAASGEHHQPTDTDARAAAPLVCQAGPVEHVIRQEHVVHGDAWSTCRAQDAYPRDCARTPFSCETYIVSFCPFAEWNVSLHNMQSCRFGSIL
jgi:hypothetical protein